MKHKKKHHSDPIVGGTSEDESKAMGHGQFANMPQQPIMKAYPANHSGDKHLDDTMGRLDTDYSDAKKKMKKDMSNGMY